MTKESPEEQANTLVQEELTKFINELSAAKDKAAREAIITRYKSTWYKIYHPDRAESNFQPIANFLLQKAKVIIRFR